MALAMRGFRIHPLHHVNAKGDCSCGNKDGCADPKRRGKHSRLSGWQELATRDLSQISKWWGQWPLANPGIVTGLASGMFATDFDGRDGRKNLEALIGPLPETFTVKTGSDGEHDYFQHPGPEWVIHDSVKTICANVDIRGDGNKETRRGSNLVAPGAANARGRYSIKTDAPISPCPPALLALIATRREPMTTATAKTPETAHASGARPRNAPNVTADAEKRARLYAQKLAPSISGQDGHGTAMRAAMKIAVGFDLDEETAFRVLDDCWNDRCEPLWSEAELLHKIRDALEKGTSVERGAMLRETQARQSARAAPTIGAADGGDEWSSPASGHVERAIIYAGNDLHRQRAELSGAIARHPDFFQRAQRLVHIERVPSSSYQGPTYGLAIGAVTEAILAVESTRVAKFLDVIDGKEKECAPDRIVVKAVHQQHAWHDVRSLTGVLEAPALRSDGTIIQTPGYDAATGYFYEPSEAFDAVPDAPTQDEARHAFEALREIYDEFPFVSDDARALPIAAALTVLARPAIRGSVPAFLFEANTAGSGKTLLADTVSMLARGRDAGKMSFPATDDELEKILSSEAIAGSEITCFDNVRLPFGGAPLDKFLTAVHMVSLRVLGKTESRSVPWNSVILSTGNNYAFSGDTARRCLVARLEVTEDRPETRSGFRHHPLLAWIRQHRLRFVRCLLIMARAWYVAGKPVCDGAEWGSFGEWASTVPQIIRFAGGPNVLTCRGAEAGTEDLGRDALSVILDQWSKLDPSIVDEDGSNKKVEGSTVRSLLLLLFPSDARHRPPDAWGDLRDVLEMLGGGARPSAKQVGFAFRAFRGRYVKGRALVTAKTDRNGVAKWKIVGKEPTPKAGQ